MKTGIEKIVLKINGKEIEASLEDVRKLRDDLDTLLGKDSVPYYPMYPFYPYYETPSIPTYPTYTPITCGITTDSKINLPHTLT